MDPWSDKQESRSRCRWTVTVRVPQYSWWDQKPPFFKIYCNVNLLACRKPWPWNSVNIIQRMLHKVSIGTSFWSKKNVFCNNVRMSYRTVFLKSESRIVLNSFSTQLTTGNGNQSYRCKQKIILFEV